MLIATPSPAESSANWVLGNARAGGSSVSNVEAVRSFLREVGRISESDLDRSYSMVVGYLRDGRARTL